MSMKDNWVVNKAGTEIYYPAAEMHMSQVLTEILHTKGYDTPQEFFTAYEELYKYVHGKEWFLSEKNPVW